MRSTVEKIAPPRFRDWQIHQTAQSMRYSSGGSNLPAGTTLLKRGNGGLCMTIKLAVATINGKNSSRSALQICH